MRSAPDDNYGTDELQELNAKQWQVDLLNLNPSYTCWGPYEDYMSGDDGWSGRVLNDTWSDFGPWGLDELNELVNFYFAVNRKSEDCCSCDSTGYGIEAKKLADAWYDFGNTGSRWCDKITQDEVDALVAAGRLNGFDNPTASEVNAWEKGRGMGHDAINRSICIRARCERLGYELHCPHCSGNGYIYTAEVAHVSLTLWFIHPRKGCSRGVEIANIEQDELPSVFKFLKDAAERNAERFSRIPK